MTVVTRGMKLSDPVSGQQIVDAARAAAVGGSSVDFTTHNGVAVLIYRLNKEVEFVILADGGNVDVSVQYQLNVLVTFSVPPDISAEIDPQHQRFVDELSRHLPCQ